MQGFLHHIDLSVEDPRKSRPLYDLFLGHAGFRLKSAGDDWAGYGLEGRRYPCITLLKSRGENASRVHDRYSPGLHHLALAAFSRADVDDLYQKLIEEHVDILDPPRLYPDYGEEYYAVFFADRDGLKLEYVFTPEPQELVSAG